MRVVINDIAASTSGAITILNGLYNYIISNDSDDEWIFLISSEHFQETEKVKTIILGKVKSNWLQRLKFDYVTGRKVINSLKPDVVLSLQNTIVFGVKAPQVVYMHQSIPFQNVKNFSFLKRDERLLAVYQHLIGLSIKKSLKKAHKVIVQTEWIRKAVIEKTGIINEKVHKVFPDIPAYSEYIKRNIFDNHKFFFPSGSEIYKNHKCIYDACYILIRNGITDFKVELTIKEKNDNECIVPLGKINFEDVLRKYNECTLLFPSYIETVGLPMAEARRIGALILASDCPFSHEVLDGYENAYFFNPFDPNELAELMKKVIDGEIKKKDIEETFDSGMNSWQEVIEILDRTYREAR